MLAWRRLICQALTRHAASSSRPTPTAGPATWRRILRFTTAAPRPPGRLRLSARARPQAAGHALARPRRLQLAALRRDLRQQRLERVGELLDALLHEDVLHPLHVHEH